MQQEGRRRETYSTFPAPAVATRFLYYQYEHALPLEHDKRQAWIEYHSHGVDIMASEAHHVITTGISARFAATGWITRLAGLVEKSWLAAENCNMTQTPVSVRNGTANPVRMDF